MQTGSNFLFGEQWLSPCNSTMHTIVVQCSPDGGLMNINISQCEKGLLLLRGYPEFLADYYMGRLRSSEISFVCAMIYFHKHDQTLIDPCSLKNQGRH